MRARIQARKEATSQARSQAFRQPARSQATTKAAPEQASTSQARSQAFRLPARSQASTKAAPEQASRSRPLYPTRTTEYPRLRDRALANARAVNGAFASRSRKPVTVAKAHRPEYKPAGPRGLPVRPAKPSSSAPSTLPSGGQLTSKPRHGAGVAGTCAAALRPKAKTAPGPVEDSSLPAGVYEKVMREGSDGPAFTLRKLSWKFGNGYENIFSPPEGRVVLSPEPEEESGMNLDHVPLFITPVPRYLELGKTPVRPDCARPRRRRRHMAPSLPAPPPDQSVYWPDRSETRLTSAGSVAKKAAPEKVSGSSDRSRSLQLRHRLGSAGHREPAHKPVPARSALRNGTGMAKKTRVRFDDTVRERIVSRWVTDVYPSYDSAAGAIVGWTPDPDWNPDPEHPSDNSHIRLRSMHPSEYGHHRDHRVGRWGFGDGDPLWGNVSSCAPHLRELDWPNPCPFQSYKLPRTKELGVQGECTCELSGPFDCPRKIYRKRQDLAYVSLTCRGPNNGKLAVLRYVLAGMNWDRGVAVIPRGQ